MTIMIIIGIINAAEYIKWRKHEAWMEGGRGGRYSSDKWCQVNETIKSIDDGTNCVWRHFWTKNSSKGLSGSRISRSFIKGNCTKCKLSDDFHIYLICCNNTWGNLKVKNMSNLIEFQPNHSKSRFVDKNIWVVMI